MPETPKPTMDQLAQVYLAIKDARTVKRHAWEAEDLALEQEQSVIKVAMLEMLNGIGGSSVKTDHGTVIRTEKVRPAAADWDAFYDWVLQDKGRFEALEKRIKSTFISQFMEENAGQLPPGVNVHREYEVAVRRPTASNPITTERQAA